jgi:hypothetical protein
MFRNFYPSSVILSAKIYLSRSEPFYEKVLLPATMKLAYVFMYFGQYLHLILTTLGFSWQILTKSVMWNFTKILPVGKELIYADRWKDERAESNVFVANYAKNA